MTPFARKVLLFLIVISLMGGSIGAMTALPKEESAEASTGDSNLERMICFNSGRISVLIEKEAESEGRALSQKSKAAIARAKQLCGGS